MGESDPRLRCHERYVVEVVEELGLCPFARRSRELGRVHRPVFESAPSPTQAAETLATWVKREPETEIVLLTFLTDDSSHPFHPVAAFETFTKRVRERYAELGGPVFYMVAFHPGLAGPGSGTELNPDNLVPLIRRTPDPVIQCVQAAVLDRVRREAQVIARARARAMLLEKDPALAELFDRSISPDPELSADIARHNFQAVGGGSGREELERRINAILRARTEF